MYMAFNNGPCHTILKRQFTTKLIEKNTVFLTPVVLFIHRDFFFSSLYSIGQMKRDMRVKWGETESMNCSE